MAEVAAGSLGAAALEDSSTAVVASESTSIVARSGFDTAYSFLAHRSEHAARIVRDNESVMEAMRTVSRWIIGFCEQKGCMADEIVVNGSMTPEGAIALNVQLRSDYE